MIDGPSKDPRAFGPGAGRFIGTPRSEKDRVAISLDPEKALEALLKVDPESEPANDARRPAQPER
jgi:hypothetical protein